jgi:cbb3-type cytochrome oxidase subunit 3
LYSLGAQNDCFIGISSIPDKYNQYRLGTIFLRNFYTGLDFENNMLLIGINQGTTSAELHGKAENPFKPREGNGAVLFVITFIIVMIAVAVACFVRSKRNEQDSLVNFSEEDSAVNKKGLIEEENKEGEGGTGAINESITEDREEDLDHDEELVE